MALCRLNGNLYRCNFKNENVHLVHYNLTINVHVFLNRENIEIVENIVAIASGFIPTGFKL